MVYLPTAAKTGRNAAFKKPYLFDYLLFIASLTELFWCHARQTFEVFREKRRIGEIELLRNLDDGLITVVQEDLGLGD